MLTSPLEQFQIVSLFSIKLFCLDFSITNLLLINLLVLVSFIFLVKLLRSDDLTLFFISNNWQTLIENIYKTVSQLLFDNINIKGEKYLPFISILFLYILLVNLIGLVSYNFTVTNHLIITFT